MDIVEASAAYEKWLARWMPLDSAALKVKHRLMCEPFPFLRGSYYRWAQVWPKRCADVAGAPEVLSVGDLHVANFGTWRDAEGRLVWGVNDFDEATPLPYTNDLVRLAASARMAIADMQMRGEPDGASERILAGYSETMRAAAVLPDTDERRCAHGWHGGFGRPPLPAPIVLAETNTWLTEIAMRRLADPHAFWVKLEREADGSELKRISKTHLRALKAAKAAIAELVPGECAALDYGSREAGVGSLGRPRIVGTGVAAGGRIAREAKALAPSAALWAAGRENDESLNYETIITRAVRCRDPWVKQIDRWVVRRLAPDCSRIDTRKLSAGAAAEILAAMGREAANIHLGVPSKAVVIVRDLERRKEGWLEEASLRMERITRKECGEWRKRL